ncbi:hypothetical protein CQU01_11770 [Cerasibacillus quisquiliarum]|uniref:Uncharacterized protein n=1 Tax=Cerasibacillus quisquiliarum TaxID=227865 RepID=A0A511UWH5_9BACI|nr:hypothetical protein CQU01_11770 [Cerasibacillus quisquiliarum]
MLHFTYNNYFKATHYVDVVKPFLLKEIRRKLIAFEFFYEEKLGRLQLVRIAF